MTALSPDLLSQGRELARSLRREGRADDALVIDTLVRAVEPASPFFTPDEVAQRVGVSRQTIIDWIKQGYLPGERVAGRMMVPATALDTYAQFEEIFEREGPPLSPEEAAAVVARGREHWTWVGREE